MSRQVDISKPLSKRDREYLESRSRWADIAIADGMREDPDESEEDFVEEVEPAPEGTELEDMSVEQAIAMINNMKVDALRAEIERRDSSYDVKSMKKEELRELLADMLDESEEDGEEEDEVEVQA